MLLTSLLVLQLFFDVAVAALLIGVLARRRAGAYSEDTARRDGILPAELRVLRSLAAAAPHAPPSR